ncbi:MOSC domain-containing protein [Actinacidiphila yeochonensis]|uniref:MOSC domain-containing protein n=1 Tax=Actinacidiphila yeochonensis TaxID=89050 RepID=UPI0005672FA7|nr:MOSC N-terminal beta barrel domain-containing protein [Actinacidiphila yeochonensis]
MTPPRVAALYLYPVKSLRTTGVRTAVVEPWGLAGDRRWMIADARTLRSVTQREQPALARVDAALLPDGAVRLSVAGGAPLTVAVPPPGPELLVRHFKDEIRVRAAGPEADAWLSAFLGTPVRLVHQDPVALPRLVDPEYALPGDTVSLADGYPLLLTATASLAALNDLVSQGTAPHEGPLPMDRFRPNVVVEGTEAWAEHGWRRVRIGEVVFRAPKPCARCVVTTTDQVTGERGREPLPALARRRTGAGKLLFGQNLIPEAPGTLHVGDALTLME